MDKLLEELLDDLRWMIGLPLGATIPDYIAQLNKITDQLKSATGATAATGFDIGQFLADSQGQIAALKSAVPDPAAFVPMAQYAGMQARVAALTGQIESGERESLMVAALSDGRILPAQKDYWSAQPVAALKSYLAVAQPMAALTGMQSGGAAPAGAALSSTHGSEDLAVMKALGLSAEIFSAGKLEQKQ